jgi:hypothetical protein
MPAIAVRGAQLTARPTRSAEYPYPVGPAARDAIHRTLREASATRPHPGRWHPPH